MGSSRGRALVHTLPEGLQVKQARGVGEAWGTNASSIGEAPSLQPLRQPCLSPAVHMEGKGLPLRRGQGR